MEGVIDGAIKLKVADDEKEDVLASSFLSKEHKYRVRETGKVIGEIAAYPEHGELHNTSSSLDTFSPCWMLNGAYQGKGYAYEAAHAFFDYLFREKDARRIYAYTEDYNLASQRLCKKLGMRREGLFKEFVSFVNNPDGTPHYENTVQYTILEKEWHG